MSRFESNYIYYDDLLKDSEIIQPPDEYFLPSPDTIQETIIPMLEQCSNELPAAKIFVKIPNNTLETCGFAHFQTKQNFEEIKSEPIKFELSESHTLDTTNSKVPKHIDMASETAPNLITARPKKAGKCQKCSQCSFASVFEERVYQHLSTTHSPLSDVNGRINNSIVSKKSRKCPACNNEFFTKKSLEVHLELDHEMPNNEVQILLDDRGQSQPAINSVNGSRANRIFIKSVDVLRQPIINTEIMHSFGDIPSTLDDSTILIDLINTNSPEQIMLPPLKTLQDNFFGSPLDASGHNSNSEKKCSSGALSISQRKAKIYIKNVDILKDPIIVSPMPTFHNILSGNDSLNLNHFSQDAHRPGSLDNYDCNTNNEFSNHPALENVQRKASNVLHLRTVDELNLMNMNEVQNLLAPLPEQSAVYQPSTVSSSESSDKVLLNSSTPYSVPDLPYNHDTSFNVTESDLIPANWTNYYNFNDVGTNIVATNSQIESTPSLTHFDLNTPQRFVNEETDQDILYVCTQGLITVFKSPVNIEGECPLPSNGDMGQCNVAGKAIQVDDVVEIEDDSKQQQQTDAQSSKETETAANPRGQIDQVPEKGRIYVAGNLMKDRRERAENDCMMVLKRNRGRPTGSKKPGIAKLRKTYANVTSQDFGLFECDLDCAYRFRDVNKLEYHKKCHKSSKHRMQCPECIQNDFFSWNTLHTHLWRQHKIDMELYSCELCSFKTPILSRLMNTHVKIHFNDRNFKCDQCEKTFKNSKQLKDHRRQHRLSSVRQEAHVCELCNSAFGRLKSMKEHIKKKHKENEPVSPKANKLKLQCDMCTYRTTDHNALRRHKMTHSKMNRYRCLFCDYTCIQSILYQKHIRHKHPDQVTEIILRCSSCPFVTINRKNYEVHIAKHKSSPVTEQSTLNCDIVENSTDNHIEAHNYQTTLFLTNASNSNLLTENYQPIDMDRFNSNEIYDGGNSLQILDLDQNNIHCEVDNYRHKIKVKSNSVLTDPSKFCTLEPIAIPNL